MKDGFRILDADGHMQEPLDIWDTYVESAFHDRRPKVVGHAGRYLFEYDPCEAFPEGRYQPRPESVFSDVEARYGEAWRSWWTLATRLQAMTEEGLDVQVGFPTFHWIKW